MFKSLKLYKGGTFDLEYILASLADFGYRRQNFVAEEGDFARRGEILDIFPFSFELPIRIEFEFDTLSSIKTFSPAKGTALWEHKMVIILPVKKPHAPKGAVSFTEEFPIDSFVDLEIGDYVVHVEHGIGRFLGLEKIKVGDRKKDHLVIEYDRQEKLYVPVDKMNLMQKYIAFASRSPKLCRLGSKDWLRVKQRANRGIQKMAYELLSLQAMRSAMAGHRYAGDSDWQAEFEHTFPYQETPDQLTAVKEVKSEMESGRLIDRLLCGDVGYGKTEVAMRAAFKTVMDNRQVGYLVPTTILAEQHFYNFTRRLTNFPINVQMLCRFKSRLQQKKIIEGIARGEVDVVIGTHRLLSGDIRFKELGLVIIDEEQRFGVLAKEKLKAFRLTTNVLSLTATPIPRTLYMSLMGARDLSLINTAPQNRLPIKTIVVEYDEDLIRQAILKEYARRGQVYFVHNRIKDIEKVKEKLQRLLPQEMVLAIGHGQMSSEELEMVMSAFIEGKIDVLISTMIIESGIDIPNVNTIIVNNAHRFGLSSLHQLRGRVGRFNRSAYAYFMLPKDEVVDSDAGKRLNALQQYSHLGAGFKIAMEDLEIRGAGNLLGTQQHGFITAVGFDLYCRLLREAIHNFKGEIDPL